MAEKTGLEFQEQEQDHVLFGNPTGVNSTDKSMLEMTETNRLIFNSEQSALQLAINLIHEGLKAADNRTLKYERVRDSDTGGFRMVISQVDHWAWLKKLDQGVRANQLVIRGYSRQQHLRQHTASISIGLEDEQRSIFDFIR